MGAFMDAINRARASAAQARHQRMEQEAALREQMRRYHRGYDVYPDEVNYQYCAAVRSSLTKGLVTKSLILAAGVIITFAAILNRWAGIAPLIVISAIAFLPLLIFSIYDLMQLIRFSKGNYDCYGAMVTDTRVETHTSTDSDGQTTTTYYYYVSLNGVECEVGSKQYRKAAVGQYMHFVRIKAKYRKNDIFYFFPCTAQDEENYIIAQHNPSAEMRLYSSERGSIALTLLSVFSGTGAVILFAKALITGTSGIFAASVLLVITICMIVINKLISHDKNHKRLEEKRRNSIEK